jgi:hypothetical protein
VPLHRQNIAAARVLLVDDDAGDQYLVQRALTNNGDEARPLVIDTATPRSTTLRRAPAARSGAPRPCCRPQSARLRRPGILSAVRGRAARIDAGDRDLDVIRDEDIAHS